MSNEEKPQPVAGELPPLPAPTDTPDSGDLVGWLRTYAADSGYSHNDYADVMRHAAEEIERLTAQPVQQPAAVVGGWSTEDGERVVSAITMDRAKRDGGATLSGLRPYSVPLYTAPVPAAGVQGEKPPLTPLENRIADMFGIGSEARLDRETIFMNVKNTNHFAELLFAVEREFFMVPGEPDDDYPFDEPQDECLVNSWGCVSTEQYLAQVREAIAKISIREQPDSGRDAALSPVDIQKLADLHFYQRDAATMDIRLHRFAMALLAAHSAPSSDALLSVAVAVNELGATVIVSRHSQGVQTVIYSETHQPGEESLTVIAADPANGAQAGALPEGWRIVPKKTCYALVEGNSVIASLAGPDAEENAAIIARVLAAAKKG